jgi:hypothetical protein
MGEGERDLLEWKHTEPSGGGDDDRVCDASKIAISSALHILV